MANGVPNLTPTYTGFPPALDGKISDQVWARAERIGGFQLIGGSGLAAQQTWVRVCYDRAGLYVAFECLEDDIHAITAVHTDNSPLLAEDDCVEFLISPYSEAGRTTCHRFIVNAAGARCYVRPGWVRDSETWRAAAAVLSDRWIAQLAIPFQALYPLGRNEECWRVNFRRGEHRHREMSSWARSPEGFDACGCFGRLLQPAGMPPFITFRGRPVPIHGPKEPRTRPPAIDNTTDRVDELWWDNRVVPEPQEQRRRITKADFLIRPETRILVGDDPDDADLRTADLVNSTIEKLGGARLSVVSPDLGPPRAVNAIVIGESARHDLLQSVCELDEIRIPRTRTATGSHVVDVLPERAVVVGTSPVDTYYGVQTLRQLIARSKDGSLRVPSIRIRDYARFGFRGIHLQASPDSLSFLGRLIENVLAPLKITHVVLQTDRVAWASRPEPVEADRCVPAEDIRALVDLVSNLPISMIPLVHTLSVLDEAIELFGGPEYVHVGGDGIDLLRAHEHLSASGCGMMMWGDALARPELRDLAARLPRDIIICDRQYSPNPTYPSLDRFDAMGFQVIGCARQDPRNIFTFANHAARKATRGLMQMTSTGFECEEAVLRDQPQQLYAHVLAASWSWNPVRPLVESVPYRPRAVFERLWDPSGWEAGGDYVPFDLGSHFNVSRIDSGRTMGWLGIGRGNDLRGLRSGLVKIGGVPFRIGPAGVGEPGAILLGNDGMAEAFPRKVIGIDLGAKCLSLHFVHGCAYAADRGERVGAYTIRYEDGRSEQIPLVYEQNTCAWDDQSPMMAYCFAWRERAQDGRMISLCYQHWANPRPGVRIAELDFATAHEQAAPFLIAVTAQTHRLDTLASCR